MLVWLRTTLNALILWFYPIGEDYPQDESGELMRRYMTHKSWFDKLSSAWVEKSVFEKAGYLAGSILLSGFIGIIVGEAALFMFSAVCLTLITHGLFVAHEQHRHLGAKIFAAEEIAAIQDLKASELFFKETSDQLGAVIVEINDQQVKMKEQVLRLDSERQIVTTQNETLNALVDMVETETTHMVEVEKDINQKLGTIIVHLQEYDQQVTHSTDKLSAVGTAAGNLTSAVQKFQQSQMAFSEASARFGLFVAEHHSKPIQEANLRATELERDDFMDLLDQEISDNDTFLEGWKPVSSTCM